MPRNRIGRLCRALDLPLNPECRTLLGNGREYDVFENEVLNRIFYGGPNGSPNPLVVTVNGEVVRVYVDDPNVQDPQNYA